MHHIHFKIHLSYIMSQVFDCRNTATRYFMLFEGTVIAIEKRILFSIMLCIKTYLTKTSKYDMQAECFKGRISWYNFASN